MAAITTGNTTLSRTNVVITTSADKVVSSPGNYLPLSLLDGDDTYTLPDATLNAGKVIIIDNDTGASVEIGTLGELINSSSSFALASDNSIVVKSNGTNWRIIYSHII